MMKNTMNILFICLYLIASQAVATVTMFEQEPNNKPLQANLISPPIKVLADMKKSDQDLFLWNVSDAESLYLWNIHLQGITERLTKLDVMQIHFTEDGKGVSSFDKILTISSKNGLGIEKLDGLLFAPGNYYFGLSYGGSGKPSSGLLSPDALKDFDEQTTTDIRNQTKGKKAALPSSYNLTFIRGKKLYNYSPKAKLSKENPIKIKSNYSKTLFYQEQPIWAKFTILEKETAFKWQLRGLVSLGNEVQVKLYDASDKMLAETNSTKDGIYQFTDLNLAQGDYFIELTSKDNYFVSTLQKQSIGEVIAGQEAEPNDKFSQANSIKFGDTVTGRMSKNKEYDYFKFSIDKNLSENNLAIKLQNLDKKKVELCLLRISGKYSQCRSHKKDINLNHIALTQGIYGVYVRGETDAHYSLSINTKGKRNPIMEVEPNDKYKDAAPMNAKNIVKGTFDASSEYDYFTFNVDKDPQLWTVQANGTGIENIYIYNSAGNVIQNFKAEKGNKRVRLSNLFLLPGKHVIAIRGSNGKYLLRAFATGKPDKNFETEPNDDKSRSMFLPFASVRQGVLQNTDDRDLYHFNLDNKQHIKLTITPPADGSITYKIYKFGKHIGTKTTKTGEPVSFEGIYPMGDYSIKLQSGKQTSIANYKIALQRLSVFDCAIDCEPNDSLFQAVTIPVDGVIKGWTNTHGDLDWYKLPAQEQESIVTLVNNLTKNHSIIVYDNNRKKIKVQWVSDETGANKPDKLRVTIPANTESYYKIQSNDKPYDYRVVVNGVDGKQSIPDAEKNNLNNVTINVQGLPENIKAFYSYGQVLHGKIELKNNSADAKKLSLKSHASHHLWQVKLAKDTIQLKPKSKKVVTFTVTIPNDVFTKRSQMVTIAAIDENNNNVEDYFSISAQSDVQALNPKMYWQIPQQLLGGVNVANFNLGAKRTPKDIARNTRAIGRGFDHLFDGRSVTGYGVLFRGGRKTKNDTITVDLVGEKPVKVIGFALNPLSENTPNYYPKDIEIHLSTDGINFTTQVKTQLKQVGIEQYFVLNKPQEAKYARLTIYNNHDNLVNGIMSLGEFKVIAQSENLFETKMNIASPKLGGNVIWSKPTSNNSWDISLLTDKKEKYYIRSSNGDDWQWVIGFHHQRAALIDSLEWQPPLLTGKNKTFEKVQIMASTQSPIGPWELLTKVDLSTTEITKIKLDKPTWARYLKFNVGSVEKRAYRYLPETIKVFEQAANANYQSILGEWGDGSENAIYEKTFPHDFSKNKTTDINNNSKQTAIDISQTQRAAGFVQLEQADKPDWYKFKLEQGQNTLDLELSGDPTIRTIITLEDNNGEPISAIKEETKSSKINYTYKLTAGEYYYLKIIEPPRNVVFSWDTSGSTGAYHAIIFNALQQFAQGVKPGRDEVNFQPFGGKLLMDKWYGEPYLLKTVLNNYPRNDDSSAAETYMHKSTQALENRKGSKAIIVITDAITSRDEKLWDSFKKVKPRVFSLGIVTGNGFGGKDDWQTDLMQAWARVNHGQYHQVTTGSQVEVAFERAAAKLREPANYQIKIESKFEKVKGPGTLKITQDGNTSNQSGAIELILDASGSMLKRLNGKRRINIAKQVLSKAVTEIIPAGTPVALRVFGNKQAGSCRTDLAIPLKPLDAQKANKVIQSIHAKNLAKTPIADSLAKVASDLKANKGKKIIILVTDGEETCDGNPQEAIQKLIDDGIDIRLNIVGFAIDDENLKNEFQQWSSQGGGKYFDSNNPESLKASVTQALQTPYSVYSLSGELISEGTINGEPIELAAGFYTIKVFGNKVFTYEKYQIKGEEEQIIKLD
jgi:Mg-chelatase subunit ChlD